MLTFVAAFPRSLRLHHRAAGIALAFFRPRFAQSETVYPIGIRLSDQVRPRLFVLCRSCRYSFSPRRAPRSALLEQSICLPCSDSVSLSIRAAYYDPTGPRRT